MGHYDNCYEADEEERLKKRRADLQDWLREHVDDMNLPSLEFLYHVSKNIEQYKTFFLVLQMDRKERWM